MPTLNRAGPPTTYTPGDVFFFVLHGASRGRGTRRRPSSSSSAGQTSTPRAPGEQRRYSWPPTTATSTSRSCSSPGVSDVPKSDPGTCSQLGMVTEREGVCAGSDSLAQARADFLSRAILDAAGASPDGLVDVPGLVALLG